MSTILAKHSPGPWSFEAICFDRKIAIKGGVTAYGRPYTIAHVNRPGSAFLGQDKANAHLIAAAPDMAKAIADAIVAYASWTGKTAKQEEADAALSSALAKALGQPDLQGEAA